MSDQYKKKTNPKLNRRKYQKSYRPFSFPWIYSIVLLLLIGAFVFAGYYIIEHREADVFQVPQSTEHVKISLQSETEYMESQETVEDWLVSREEDQQVSEQQNYAAVVESMTLEQKAAAYIMTTADELADISVAIQAGEQTKNRLQLYPVGGVHYTDHNFENADQLTAMLTNVKSYNPVPMRLAADEMMKTRVENIGSNLYDSGFQIDASGDTWYWVNEEGATDEQQQIDVRKCTTATEAITAFHEGADMVFIEKSLEIVYSEFLTAVQNGEIAEADLTARIEDGGF